MEFHKRNLETTTREMNKHFKVILLVGARQTGKSTLLKHLFPEYHYSALDSVTDEYSAKSDPALFLETFQSPLIIDEVQYAPQLLALIKKKVDEREQPGQYILTGSQNILTLKGVSESLAGRVAVLNLDPFTLHEQLQKNEDALWWQNTLLQQEAPRIQNYQESVIPPIAKTLWRGMMPGLLDKPDSIVPTYHKSYIETYLERDVRTIDSIENISEFHRFLQLMAALTSCEINMSQLGREIGIHTTTAKRWLSVLKQSFQWFELPPYTGNTIKRLSQKNVWHCADTGIACALLSINRPESLLGSRNFGQLFESWIISSIRNHFGASSFHPSFYHWRTNGGAEVDLVIQEGEMLCPIEVKLNSNVTKRDTSGIQAFLKTYPDQTQKGYVFYGGNTVKPLSENIWALPWHIL